MSKYKIGDYVKLKSWNKLDKEDRHVNGSSQIVSINPNNILCYNEKTLLKISSFLYDGDVIYLSFPTKKYPQPVLLKDIYTEQGMASMKESLKNNSPTENRRLIRGRIIQNDIPEEEIIRVEIPTIVIKPDEDIYLKFGEDGPIKVKLGNCVTFEDRKTKTQVIKITGLVIPDEKIRFRKIRR